MITSEQMIAAAETAYGLAAEIYGEQFTSLPHIEQVKFAATLAAIAAAKAGAFDK